VSESRIKVLFVSPSLVCGGAERVFVTLLRHLDRARFAPALALVEKTGPLLDQVPPDVEIIDLAAGRARYVFPRFIRMVRERRPDVILTAQGHLNLALLLCRPFVPRRVRYVGRESSTASLAVRKSDFPRLFSVLYRLLYPWFDALVCQCSGMREDVVRQFGFPASRAVVINNPAASRAAEPVFPAERTNLLAVGRMVWEKGYDVLLEALALARTRNPRLHLTFVGAGGLEDDLKAMTRALELEGQVTFAGMRANPYAYMARADLFVLSSRYEGFPNALIEALACGTPAVAFNCPGGLDEIIVPGLNGWLAPAGDVSALAELLARAEPHRLDRAAIAADAERRFGAGVIVRQYEALLETVVRNGRIGSD